MMARGRLFIVQNKKEGRKITLKIVKELQIQEIRGTRASNAPFQIIFEGESSLTVDAKTCARYQIPVSLDLVGRVLICTLHSWEISLLQDGDWKGFADFKTLENDDLRIDSLSQEEVVFTIFNMKPPTKYTKVARTLKLSSFGGGDGIHLSPLPCPFYSLNIDLTEEEYGACKALSGLSVFKVNFQLKP